jgi:hypothetical protein
VEDIEVHLEVDQEVEEVLEEEPQEVEVEDKGSHSNLRKNLILKNIP